MPEELLVVRASETMLAALPAAGVIETMRPLEVSAIAGTPDFVVGAAVIRGAPVPIVDLRILLGLPGEAPARRWVTLRVPAGDRLRVVGLAVLDVIGVRDNRSLDPAGAPLLATAIKGAASGLAVLDRELLVVLERGRLVDEVSWRAIEGVGAPATVEASMPLGPAEADGH